MKFFSSLEAAEDYVIDNLMRPEHCMGKEKWIEEFERQCTDHIQMSENNHTIYYIEGGN